MDIRFDRRAVLVSGAAQRIRRAVVMGVVWLSQAAAPRMQRARWGRIVTVSSGAGLRTSLTGLHAYTAANHAVIGLTRQLSVGLAQHGITANAVLFFASEQARWVTGQVLSVDGGRS